MARKQQTKDRAVSEEAQRRLDRISDAIQSSSAGPFRDDVPAPPEPTPDSVAAGIAAINARKRKKKK